MTTGLIAVHSDVKEMMEEGDCRRAEELEWMGEVPATCTWGLQTSSSVSFDSPRSEFRTCPTRPLARRLAGTPDKVEEDGYLPTAHAALYAV